MTVRALEKSEIPIAAETLALSFDDDPFFCFMMPEPRSRRRWLRWFHTTALRESSAVGGAFTLEAGPEKGAIVLYPAGTWPRSFVHTIGAAPFPPGLPPSRLLTAGIPVESRIRKLHPPGPHVYVHVLGVHPESKGKGLGGTLLRHALSLAKEAGVVAHLETSNEVNLAFYRRFGFEVREELAHHGGPPVWTLTTPDVPS
jgi:GNAT superfamily N-acetyltransferase